MYFLQAFKSYLEVKIKPNFPGKFWNKQGSLFQNYLRKITNLQSQSPHEQIFCLIKLICNNSAQSALVLHKFFWNLCWILRGKPSFPITWCLEIGKRSASIFMTSACFICLNFPTFGFNWMTDVVLHQLMCSQRPRGGGSHGVWWVTDIGFKVFQGPGVVH